MWGALWKLIEEYFAQQEEVYQPQLSTDLFPIVNPIVNDPIFMAELHKNVTPEGMDSQPDWLDSLIYGLIPVESGGNVNAVGDQDIPEIKGGPAFGILQIRGGVRSAVNVLWKTDYKGKDLLGEKGAELSKKMCRDYFLKVCPQYKAWKATKVEKTEWCARAWNGGIGWEKNYGKVGYERYTKSLDDYWKKVNPKIIK